MNETYRTELNLKGKDFPKINHNSHCLLIGSCFSDNIESKFQEFKFSCISNPFGVTYNPYSILNQLKRIIQKDYFSDKDIFQKSDSFNSYDLHGSFDHSNKDELIYLINEKIDEVNEHIKQTETIFITLGTSWVYELKSDNQIVNNCHKQDGKLFKKRCLTLDEVIEINKDAYSLLKSVNKDLNIVFTISPVRHLKDGFEENQISKSILKLSIQELMESNDVSYFPSYEIMMDDLRDYRFYEDDMLHPSKVAIEYIWEKFKNLYIDSKSQEIMEKIAKINLALNHRSFNPKSQDNIRFLENSLKQTIDLINQYGLDLSEEVKEFKSRLSE